MAPESRVQREASRRVFLFCFVFWLAGCVCGRVGLDGSVVEVLRARGVGGGGAGGLEGSELAEEGECGESASGGRVGALEEGLGDPGGGGVPAVAAVEYGGQGRGEVVGEDVGGDGGEVLVGEGDDDQVVGGDASWER